MCKFTPLGFETNLLGNLIILSLGVNLPRWGLKLRERGVAKYWLSV